MVQHIDEADAIVGSDPEASPHEVLAFVGKAGAESNLRVANGLVGLEGDVTAHHVVEEDAEAPDGGLFTMVSRASDPLGRGVDSRTCNGEKVLGQQTFKSGEFNALCVYFYDNSFFGHHMVFLYHMGWRRPTATGNLNKYVYVLLHVPK